MGSPMDEAFRSLVEAIHTDVAENKDPGERIRQLIQSLPGVLDAFDDHKRTALHHAALCGNDAILRVILDVGTRVDVRDEEECTPLHLAARTGREAVVATLVQRGANVRAEEAFGETPLHEAARSGHASIVRLLINNGAVVDSPNQDKSTALHIAARRGNDEVVRELLEAGANPQTRDAVGDTPLHDAAREGHETIVQILLETGSVAVDAQNDNDLTSLGAAARHGREGIVRILVEHGADLDSVNSDYCTPLHQAASEGHDGVVRILIAAGADVDLQDKDEQTPLHAAAIFEHEQVLLSLLAAEADVNTRDNEDCTPLHHAVKNSNKAMVRDLLEAGADPTVISISGETPQSLAKLLNRNSIADLFNSPQVVPKQSAPANFRPRRVRPPTKPNRENEVDACKHFNGLFWCPTSDRTFENLSMWDILYDPETEMKLSPRPLRTSTSPSRPKEKPEVHMRKSSYSRKDERPLKRWFHLPANNISWVMDLVQKICAMDHRPESECERISNFVEETFQEVRLSVPYRRPHFKLETKSDENQQAAPMFSIVLPVIDVELDEKTKLCLRDVDADEAQLRPQLNGTTTAAKPKGTLSAMPTNLQHYLFPHLEHFDAMDKLASSFTKSELHVPRPLDLSYHESLSEEDLRSRNESQVIYRYLQRLEQDQKASSAFAAGGGGGGGGGGEDKVSRTGAVQDPFELRARKALSSGPGSSKQKKTDGTKAELMRMTGRSEGESSIKATVAREKKKMEAETRKQMLVVSQLWLWRIDEHNIISAFPERWDNKNAKTLLNEIKHRIVSMRDLRSEDTDMCRVVDGLLDRAVCFSEDEFHFQFDGPKSYCNVFANSIAHVSNEAMKRYTAFKSSISHMGIANTVLSDLKDEIELLQEIDDILDEINMIKRVLREQERVMTEFNSSIKVNPTLKGIKEVEFAHPTLDFFRRLEEDANRVRESITTLLDLRQREANIEEALSANEQSKILFIFTGATVVFAPLSWIMALLAVKIDGLPESLPVKTIALACVGSLVGTGILIALSLPMYELASQPGKMNHLLSWGKLGGLLGIKGGGKGGAGGAVEGGNEKEAPPVESQQSLQKGSSVSPRMASTAAEGNRLRRRIGNWRRGRREEDEERGMGARKKKRR